MTQDQGKRMNASRKRMRLPWGIIISLFGLLFGSGIVFMVWQSYLSQRPPKFRVSVINTLGDKNEYEIANNWLRAPSTVPESNLDLGVEVFPTYHGKSQGKVHVVVKTQQGQELARGTWDNFDADASPLSVPLDPNTLASALDTLDTAYQDKEGAYDYPTADLLVEVVDVSQPSPPLYTETLTLANTPWYHFARVSVNYIWEQNVQVFIQGKNLGAPSVFFLEVNVYEMTNLSGYPGNPWPWIAGTLQAIDGVVGHDARLSAQVALPEGVSPKITFEPGKCYAITTVLAKKQPYVELPTGVGWAEWEHTGRFGDWWNTSLVCYPVE